MAPWIRFSVASGWQTARVTAPLTVKERHEPKSTEASEDRRSQDPRTPSRRIPEGHVGVTLTPDTIDECIEVTIHDVRHCLTQPLHANWPEC